MAKPTRYTEEMIRDYLARGIWSNAALADFWDKNSAIYPDRVALVDSRTRLTWSQSKLWIDRIAFGLLELGLKKDDVLVVQLPNSIELCFLRLACEKTSILCLPVQRNLRHLEMEYILRKTEAAALVIPQEFQGFNYYDMVQGLRHGLPQLRHILITGEKVPAGSISIKEMVETPRESKYPADYLDKTKCPGTEFSLILHTTGTTGFPKFVEYPVCPRIFSNKAFIDYLQLKSDDVLGCFSAASVGPNGVAYFTAPEIACKTLWIEHFEPEKALELIEKERITVGLVVPTVLVRMLNSPALGRYDTSSIRLWWSAGAMLPYQVAVEAEEKLGGVILSGLGATDWGGFTILPLDAPREERLLTVGKPPEGVIEIKLVDDHGETVSGGEIGEVWGRGPACLSGYYKDPEATWQAWTRDGWFKMGDLAKWDEKGNLVLVGRKKDMIIRAGQNIYPIEIENLLITHPKVDSAAIVGTPDKVLGEKACAFVVPKRGQDFSFSEMIDFLKNKRVALYKLPEQLVIIDKIPLVADQKVDKKALQQMMAK